MKKRQVKKWISRYIKPHIKNLPRKSYWDHNTEKSITLVNGDVIPEGRAYDIETNPFLAICKQQSTLINLLELYRQNGQQVYIRREPEAIIRENRRWDREPEEWSKYPRMRFYGIGMRLLIDKQQKSI